MKPATERTDPRRSLRVTVIGCGSRFTSAVLPALSDLNVTVVSIIDPDPAAGARLLAKLGPNSNPFVGTRVTPETLRNGQPDAAVIASPSGLHYKHAMSCLKLGIPTFVEKPIACNTADAQALKKAANLPFAASDQRIHREDLVALNDMIKAGQLGEIHHVRYYDTIRPAPHFITSWRNDPALAGGGVLFDLGYHTINTIQWLLGQATCNIRVLSVNLRKRGLNVEDRATVAYTYEGIKIDVRVGLVSASPREVLTVSGSKALVTISRRRGARQVSRFEVHWPQQSTETDRALDPSYDTRTFVDFIGGYVSPENLDRHILTVEILERIYGEASKCRP